MPGFGDSAFIVILALLLFGPKKLPVLARQLGKLMGDFRRASNEFRSQMEEELRLAEQADRQKETAALEAANANKIVPPAGPDMEPHHPAAGRPTSQRACAEGEVEADVPAEFTPADETHYPEKTVSDLYTDHEPAAAAAPAEAEATAAPIATSGDLTMMPPETGLPVARTNGAQPSADSPAHERELETQTLHG